MKLLFAELKKLRQNRICLACLAGLVLVNLFLLWTRVRPLEGRAPAAAYRAIARELDGLSAEEQLALVEQQLEQTSALYKIEQILRVAAASAQGGDQLRAQNADLFEQYGDLYQEGGYLRYADTLSQEYFFLDEIARECEQVVGYDAFLDEIAQKSELLSGISIFAATENDDYAQQNIRRTAAAYEGMRGREIDYAPQKGLMTALNFVWTDVMAVLGMVVLAAALVRQERDNGMLALIRSTPRGRLRTSLAKLAALAVGLALLLAALYGVNLLYCGGMYGLGSLSRSIQSVPDLMRSTLKVDVAGYLVLFLLSKWAASFVCGVWVLWACLIARRALAGYALALGLPAASLLVRALIPATSRWNVIKYANLASLMQNNELLGGYRNLYWFGGPVQLAAVELVAAILFCGLFVSLFCTAFCRAQLLTAPRRASGRRGILFRRLLRTKHAHGLLAQECYKLLILCGAAAVFVAFLGFQIYETAVSENFITIQEIYYANYMKHLAGPVTQEKLEWLSQEGQKFKPLTQAQQAVANGRISAQQYQDVMNANYALQQEYDVYQQVFYKLYYLKEHPEPILSMTPDMPNCLITTAHRMKKRCCSADCADPLSVRRFLNGVFHRPAAGGQSDAAGQKEALCQKNCISSALSAAVSLAVLLPRLWRVGTGYGFSAVTAPLYSLTEYAGAPVSIPVFMLMFVSLTARFAAGWGMAMLMLLLSQRLKNMLSAALVGGLLLCMPALLNLYGLSAAKWFSLYPLFHFGAMMQQTGTAIAAWLFLAVWVLIGCETLYFVYMKWCE